MNSAQGIGLWYLIEEFLDAVKTEEHDKVSKKVFGVKAKKVDIKAVERAVVEAKKCRCRECMTTPTRRSCRSDSASQPRCQMAD